MNEFTQKLSNCTLTKIDVDTEHYYFADGEYFVSLTHMLDVGGPFPEGLRQWLRHTDAEESAARLEMTKDRGTKLHRALESLTAGLELYLEDYPTTYEKDAIVTFIRTMRFLQPKDLKTELIVADVQRKVGGTLDLVATADLRRIEALLKPVGKLKLVGDDFELIKPLTGSQKLVRFVMDYKFTGRSSYNHGVQASKYREMYNKSYAKDKKATKSYIWRYSPKHKLHYDMKEAGLRASSFNRIYDTAIEYLGGFPKPPVITVFPERVRLFELTKKEKA